MKAPRGLLPAAAAVLILAAGAAGLASDARFQTWAAHRMLARHPAAGLSVGSVSLGLRSARLQDLRLENRGAVLTVPRLEAELPVLSAGLGNSLLIHRLVAHGWTLDLRRLERRTAGRPAVSARSFSLVPTARAAALPAPVVEPFRGVLDGIGLPLDFSLDGVDLEGDVILPAGIFHCVLSGGGLAAGGEGRFVFTLRGAPRAPGSPVNALAGDGTVLASMESPRRFRGASVRIDVAASGPSLPRPVRLTIGAGAVRAGGGETYSATLAGENKQLAAVQAGFPGPLRRIAGTWKLDLCDDDLTPFMMGRPLPVFDGVGEGAFDADEWLDEVHVRGSLMLAADRLGLVRAQLAAVGPVRLSAAFDLTRRGRSFRVDTLRASLAGARPVLAVRGLQAFGFNQATRELTVADASRDILEFDIQELPVSWAQPFLGGIVVSGGTLRGRMAAGARNGGMTIHSTAPLALAGLGARRGGRGLVRDLDLSLGVWADYAPRGWQLEAKARGGSLLYGEARMGRLAGLDQPIKLTGQLNVDLASALPRSGLRRGALVCDFAGSLARTRALEVRIGASGLVLGDGELPEVTARIRADAGPSGRISIKAPILVSRDGRRSDLTLDGTVAESPSGLVVEGRLAGDRVHLEDAVVLAGVFPCAWEGGAGSAPAGRARLPFWSGVTGRLAFAFRSAALSRVEASDVSGVLVASPGSLAVDGLHADFGKSGDARVNLLLAHDPASPRPYALSADVNVGSFDPAPLFLARYPERMPTIEGKFDVSGRVSGRGEDPAKAALDSGGDLRFASDGGVLRLVSVASAPRDVPARKGAGIGSILGGLASAVTGRRDEGHSLVDVAGRLSTIPYDQMSFTLSRAAGGDTLLKDFALIAPEIRLAGSGRVACQPGVPVLRQPLEATFRLRARGRTADFFRLAGMLDAHADDLGYSAFTEPLVVLGTLGRPDTSQLQATLLRDAYRNSGAKDLFDKLLGK